jgi:hypothetical protein
MASRRGKTNGRTRADDRRSDDRGRSRIESALLRRLRRLTLDEPRPQLTSATAFAAEALRTGVLPAAVPRRVSRIPHEDETMKVGDPDDDGLANEYVGDELPGGSTPTPDQSVVDEIGRAYGVQDGDSGALRTSSEVLDRRDRHRAELEPPSRPDEI